MANLVIVDENAGRNTALWREFQRALGGNRWDYIFLSEAHPGIPDVEILDKLLRPDTVLLTGDRVLHERAIQQGVRSYTLNESGQLTRKRQPGVKLSSPPVKSVHADLQTDYRHKTDHNITVRLREGLGEKQLKRFRTARRRIRNHFGSARAISQVAVTVGSRTSRRGYLCGFVFHVASTSGQKGLRAREGYCLSAARDTNPALPVIHALRDLYLLQLEQVPTEVFIIPQDSFELSHGLLESEAGEAEGPIAGSLCRLLRNVSSLSLHSCVKGRFFDDMQRKLIQVDHTGSNELKRIDFAQLANSLLSECEA